MTSSRQRLVAFSAACLGIAIAVVNPLRAGPARHALAGPGCAASDARAALIADRIAYVLADTSESIRGLRIDAGFSGIGPTSVQLVSDSTVCNRARAALDSKRPVPATNVAPTVFSVGQARYAIGDSTMVHRYNYFVVMDTAFRDITTISY